MLSIEEAKRKKRKKNLQRRSSNSGVERKSLSDLMRNERESLNENNNNNK